MTPREQYRAARRHFRTEPSLFTPAPQGIPEHIWKAADASCVKRVSHWSRKLSEWHTTRKASRLGCTCRSCAFTSRFMHAGFARWPCDEPKGKKASESEYRSHVSHLWEGVNRKVQTVGDFYGVPAGMTRAEVQAVLQRSFEPVRVPTLLDLARQLRAERRAEREALKAMRRAA